MLGRVSHLSGALAPIHYTAAVFSPIEVLELLGVGLAAGALGGMLGIGGSIIMIPALTVALRQNHQLSQAAAMIVNFFVAFPAMIQHHRAGAVRWDVMKKMLPAGIVLIFVGVEASNHIDDEILKRCFGVFLLYIIAVNIMQMSSGKPEPLPEHHRVGWPGISAIGGLTGFLAGLLGIGGGNIAIPLLQRFARLPLRQCIATAAAFMCVTATLGALRKNLTLPELGLDPMQSLLIAAWLAPTAVLGGMLGSKLTHVLPLNVVRVAFLLLLAFASAEMLGLIRL